MSIDVIVMRREIEVKKLILLQKARAISKKLFKLMTWKYDTTVLNVIMFCILTVLKVSFSDW